MLFRLPIVKFFNRLLNRITVTVVLVVLQIAWLAWVFFALTTGTARVWVTGVLNGLSLLIILYLVRKDENSAYKVGWIALIGLLPLLGYGFDYITRVYTNLLATGNQAAVEFMPFVCCVAYLMFLARLSKEQEARARLEQLQNSLNLQVFELQPC